MPRARFVHLHVHTDYSLLDGACSIGKLGDLASQFKLPALAITDHGNMFGAIEFYRMMEKRGIKPIIGEEMYVAPTSMKQKKTVEGISSFHITVLVKNEKGYKNLMKLSSLAYIEGFYYKPRIDKDILREYSEGLIGLSGCLKGEIPYYILKGNLKRAKEVAKEYLSIFGKGNFYLELMRLGLKDNDIVEEGLLKISEELSIPIVATNDCHYFTKEDSRAHDVLLCIQTGKDIADDKRLKFESNELYFKSPAEMESLFYDHPEAIENTVEVAEKCNLELELGTAKVHLPHYPIPKEYSSADEYLTHLAEEGLKTRYPKVTSEIKKRFYYELDTIKKLGFSGYFLIIKDLIDEAKSRGIPVGPGRGSAVGSLVLYSLGITQIDPLKYNLVFERFLNLERVSMPDIDIDFSDTRRDEILEYIENKYGEENVCQIITFGTMAAKAVIRDVGRVLKIPYSEVDRIAKAVPFGATIKEALTNPEFKAIIKAREEYKELLEIAQKLEGLARHASTHAAGIVITPGKLTEYVPLFKTPEGNIVTQYSMKPLEDIGLLKIDLLGLRTLTVIHNTKELLKQQGKELNDIPEDDKKTFDLLKKGETTGVFQLESPGMKDILRKTLPDSFTDLMAVLALYRPGPLRGLNKESFIRRKRGEEPVEFMHPLLEPILKETYGTILYQEQVMQIASKIAGFSLGEADVLRRAMGKKLMHIMDEKRKAFIDGALRNNVPEEIAKKLFDLMIPFAGYGFNKSHSAGYALISYQTAYLKAHHPLEFMAASLSSEMGDSGRINLLVNEARKMRIKILEPDINKSEYDFKPEDGGIRFGLGAIKNVGKNTVYAIVEERNERGDFKSIFDLTRRVNSRVLKKKALESLIKAGALSSIEKNRKKLLSSVSGDESQQTSLFTPKKDAASIEYSLEELLAFEKEALGFYLSGHPLERYKDEFDALVNCKSTDIKGLTLGEEVVLGGIVVSKKKIKDRNGNPMAFVKLEDFDGEFEVTVFQDLYKRVSLEKGVATLVKGKVSLRDERKGIIASKIISFAEAREKFINRIDIYIRLLGLEEETIDKLKDYLSTSKGKCQVFLHLIDEGGDELVIRSKTIKVSPKKGLLSKVRKLLGEDSVKLGGKAM